MHLKSHQTAAEGGGILGSLAPQPDAKVRDGGSVSGVVSQVALPCMRRGGGGTLGSLLTAQPDAKERESVPVSVVEWQAASPGMR